MSLLQDMMKRDYLTESDDSGFTYNDMTSLRKMISRGAENSGEWSNALELVHKAFSLLELDRPTNDMKTAWKQYEELITYSVQQLSKYHGKDGSWRLTSESFTERQRFNLKCNEGDFIVEANSQEEIIEYFSDIANHTTKVVESDEGVILEFWEYGAIKTDFFVKIS